MPISARKRFQISAWGHTPVTPAGVRTWNHLPVASTTSSISPFMNETSLGSSGEAE